MSRKNSNLRFIHNIENAPVISIYTNDIPLALNLSYQQCTSYLNIKKSTIIIKNAMTLDVITTLKFEGENEKYYTLLISGTVNNIDKLEYEDDLNNPAPGSARFTFVHGVYDAPDVDVFLDNKKIMSNVKYTESFTEHIIINNYTVSLIVKVSGTENVIVGPSLLYYISGGIYTVIASGTLKTKITAISITDNYNNIDDVYQNNFNVQAYMGKWYQIASIPQFYDKGCVKQTAEYTLLNNKVNVYNRCLDANNNILRTITGYAVSNSCTPAALTVVFQTPNPNQSVYPNYLVHLTDYINFAIVGSPTRTSFYILSRLPKISNKKYNEFICYADKLGYNTKLITKS